MKWIDLKYACGSALYPCWVVRPVGNVEDEEDKGVDDLHIPLIGVGNPARSGSDILKPKMQ